MGKNKYRFKGHESFILREGWLNKGLYEVDRNPCLLYTSPSPRDGLLSRMPSSA